MEYHRILLKDYKNENDDILVADKQLQKELIYDMQKYEFSKGKIKAVAKMRKSSSDQSPDVSKVASGKHAQNKFSHKSNNNSKLASVMGDAIRKKSPKLQVPSCNQSRTNSDIDDDAAPSSSPSDSLQGAHLADLIS
ncbi:hypothetical protein CMV_019051 [Castanea mollissima]|uniref:Uncharacterized protein n=1 Tax=Castanea mollissima TaxID=60419 RepID=A0A8J4QQT4_9ROSI|nr:hypothetical protein CMV_019051 [Castanea mollissima]